MNKLTLLFTLLSFSLFITTSGWSQHPIAFSTKSDLDFVKKNLKQYPVLHSSFTEMKNEVDQWLGKDVDVPWPKDPAGGYTHDKHKSNYMLMFNSGLLYNLTGDSRYAGLVKNLLLKYAILNPQLKKPSAGHQQFARAYILASVK